MRVFYLLLVKNILHSKPEKSGTKLCLKMMFKTHYHFLRKKLSANQTSKSPKKAIKILRSRTKELLVKIPKEAFLPFANTQTKSTEWLRIFFSMLRGRKKGKALPNRDYPRLLSSYDERWIKKERIIGIISKT